MTYISSDTNVWIDFMTIGKMEIPFLLPYTYIMSKEAIEDELLSPPGLGSRLISFGLVPVEITAEEFFLAERYGNEYLKLSRYDRIALAIAKQREIVLLTGDSALRKAAKQEGVTIMGTLGVLDQLLERRIITEGEYIFCLIELQKYNGGPVRLPKDELDERIKRTSRGCDPRAGAGGGDDR